MHGCALEKLVITELLSIIIPLSVPKVCRFYVQVCKAYRNDQSKLGIVVGCC